MKKILTTMVLIAASFTVLTAQPTAQWPTAGREAKAGSRWWWMGSAVDKENLRWQMEQLAEAGIGTLEITPIYGVKGNESHNIQFLSTAWLDMLNYVLQVGDELGIDIDMATGTGWPFGGPMVKTTESAAKLVTEEFTLTGNGTQELTQQLNTSNGTLQRVMAFPKSGTDGQVTDLTALVSGRTLRWTAPTGSWRVIAAYCQHGVMQVKRPSPGSAGLVVDHFDSTAVANYLKYFDTRFEAGNGRWPHSFFNDSYEIAQADWTPLMFQQFEQRRGYKLEENLDKLLDRDKQVYADFRQTLSELLQENFTRQWTRWAHSHGATTRNQAHGSPANIIDIYAEADIPETENFYMNSFGISGLRDDRGFYNQALSSRATLKYASSAAHISGKRLTSSESMTWLTEHFRTSLSQIKPELDLLFTSGVNHVLFHGTAYSPQQAAWPGWKFYAAIDMSPTNSIWHDAPYMMKYIERVQSFLQLGQPDNDVLIYAPFANAMHKNTGSYQNRFVMFDINSMSQKMQEVEKCADELEKMGLDCDYTSEHFLMHTTFTNGLLQTEAGTRYKALVIPVTENMPDSVKAHIDELRLQGAVIVEGYTAAALSAITAQGEALRSEMGLSVIRRSNGDSHHYFVANLTPNDVEGYATLSVPFKHVTAFNPMTGYIADMPVKDGKVWISLKSGESVILQTNQQDYEPTTSSPVSELNAIAINGPWTLSFAETGQTYQLPALQSWETIDETTASFMGTGTYETTFTLTASQMATATAGFRLNLGDVRESARVWLNGEYIGCAWAVPFIIDCGNTIHEGENSLRIEVTNLPANRISQMDRQGTVWRIFEDINMSNISGSNDFSSWQPVPSGLNSSVTLIPVATHNTAVTLQLKGLAKDIDNTYYTQYLLTLPEGVITNQVTIIDANGTAFTAFTTQTTDEGLLLTMKGKADGQLILQVTDSQGTIHYNNMFARGGYNLQSAYDFTSETALTGNWEKMKATTTIMGFSAEGSQAWYRSKKSIKENNTLYDGLTFLSEKNTYYCVFPGYGLNAFNDFSIAFSNAATGDLLQLSYVQGDGTSAYQAADSTSLFVSCDNATSGLSVSLLSRSNFTIYRSALLFRPVTIESAITLPHSGSATSSVYHTLQGVRVERPARGVYILNGRKVVR